jgi:hypothetical protein
MQFIVKTITTDFYYPVACSVTLTQKKDFCEKCSEIAIFRQ